MSSTVRDWQSVEHLVQNLKWHMQSHFSFSACAPGRPRHAASFSRYKTRQFAALAASVAAVSAASCGLHGDSVVYHGAFAWRVTWNNRLTKTERGITNYAGFLSFTQKNRDTVQTSIELVHFGSTQATFFAMKDS